MSSSEKIIRMGEFMVKKNMLTQEQVNEIIKEQKKIKDFTRLRFGRIAINKGYMTENAVNKFMMEKYEEEKR